jgi:hypothetical protein
MQVRAEVDARTAANLKTINNRHQDDHRRDRRRDLLSKDSPTNLKTAKQTTNKTTIDETGGVTL